MAFIPPTPNVKQSSALHQETFGYQLQQEIETLAASNTCDPGTFLPRARFNLTQDGRHLNAYLPYRAFIQNQPEKLAQYEALVKKLQTRALFYETDLGFSMMRMLKALLARDATWETTVPLMATLKESHIIRPLSDPATRYLTAASIVELLHHRSDLIKAVIHRPSPLTFIVTPDDTFAPAGLADSRRNLILLNKAKLWNRAVPDSERGHWPNPAKHSVGLVALHEFIHCLSRTGDWVWTTLPDLPMPQTHRFFALRNFLFNLFYRCWGLSPIAEESMDPRYFLGLRKYGFKNHKEFLTTTLDSFVKTPARLCQTPWGRQIYEIYRNYFGTDPLQWHPVPDSPLAASILENVRRNND